MAASVCPNCGSRDITYEGLVFGWLCLNVDCLHEWKDEDATFYSFPAPPLNTGDSGPTAQPDTGDQSSGPTA